ncbi:hypothetical protein [Marinobacter sp. CHS3-4]|uniref:hypothetical protein n=1 Tax=Marinobacter sp. CHS3-4 TaxID=3045174 RepID=UPI0024B5D6ED|nr:hypothetical protein [Marinobacter sp. CHS3-4]MDI9244256.1 hypothetical protein [Marinobacter sp. CHS3-4]
MTRIIAAVLILAASLGCVSQTTNVEQISAVPEAPREYRSIMVFAATDNTDIREALEAQLVSSLNDQGFVARHFDRPNKSLPWGDPTSLHAMIADAAREGQFDGVLVTSLIKKQSASTHIPGQVMQQPVSVSLGATASATYMQTTSTPDYYQTSINYVVKTTLFDTESSQPVWQLYSKTVNPDSLSEAAKDFGQVLSQALKKTIPHQKR